MFNRFTSLLQNAVDSFVPNLTLQEEFIHHWNAVTHYFVDNKEARRRIEETAIPGHIEQMVLILVQEEREELEPGTTGPCLEYLLHHKLLETLYTLGRTDHPPGMKQVILIFFTKLLSRIRHPLLPHINVYKAVQRLVKTCGEVRAAPTEKEEIEYLCTVCGKVKDDPKLVNFFIEPVKSSKSSSLPKTNTAGNQKALEFCLVNALLKLSSSHDARVCVKACEGLMLCASLPEQSAADCLVRHTQFCDILITRLCELYRNLPSVISPSDIESVDAKWGLDAVVTVKEDMQTFKGKWQLTSFLAWLDFCDQLIAVSHPTVAAALATTITEKLLLAIIQKDILQTSETGSLMATSYFTKCLHVVCSPPLLIEFSHFILGTDQEMETPETDQYIIRKRLLDRCDHLSDEVSVVTMRLFETLLYKEDEYIYHNLVLRNFIGRSYLHINVQDSNTTSKDEVVKSIANLTQVPVSISSDVLTDKSKLSLDSEDKSEPCLDSKDKTKPSLDFKEESESSSDSKDKSEPSLDAKDKWEPSLDAKDKWEPSSGSKNKSESSSDSKDKPESSSDSKDKLELSSDSKDMSELSSDLCVEKNETSNSVQDKCRSKTEVLESVQDNCNDQDKNLESVESFDNLETSSDMQKNCEKISKDIKETEQLIDEIVENELLQENKQNKSSSNTYYRSEVHKIVTSFLSLLPEEAKSSYQTADSGYDMYLKDAHKQYSNIEQICKPWHWPTEPITDKDFTMNPFWEGSFMKMLLDKLARTLNQSYAVNLLVTSLISRLALLPHPNIQEYLLDPNIPILSSTRTLYTVLKKLSAEITVFMKSEKDFQNKLVSARKDLMGAAQTVTRLRLNPMKPPSPGFDDQNQMEAIIVLEEFCKELSAITFVKYHAAVTGS